MENKNNVVMFSVVFLIIGMLTGWLIGNKKSDTNFMAMNHQMPSGEMMNNEAMSMDQMMQGMMAGLEGKTGDEFDKKFLPEMIMHHQGAVEMAQAALMHAKHQEIKDLANGIIAAQNKEIKMMQDWQAAWYK